MQKHTEMTLKRLTTYQNEFKARLYPQSEPVALTHYAAPGRISYEQALQGQYQPVQAGIKLESLWSTHWFHIIAGIPPAWQGKEVHLLWDSSSEATVWEGGQAQQGLTGSSNGWSEDPIRKAYPVTREASAHQTVDLMIEVALNGLFGVSRVEPRKNESIGLLRQAELALFDRPLWDLYWDFVVVADMARYLPLHTPRAGQALQTANRMINTIRWGQVETYLAAREIASQFLGQRNGGGQHHLSAIGHAHIDTAWLWPIAETKRKCVRTFSSALRLMEAYPDFKFACSQMQQLAWIKADYPSLYARIKDKVASGQFIPVGGTWVEPDTNIPSGESLVRQFLYGQQFLQQEFGSISHVFWEPDVFGYSAALPQIMHQAGIHYFLTQKLSWNEFNQPARHTFLWEGLDGSQVLAHFPPADTYNSVADVRDVLHDVRNFKDHERANESYLLFGYGDGGGGPTAEMLEQLARMTDVNGLPLVTQRTPEEFFERAEDDLEDATRWVGELYFENHRGTYTTQAALKKGNRRCEELLHDVEFLASLASLQSKMAYPHQQLNDLWQPLLTNQFHDILPGSSITEVNQEARETFQEIIRQGEKLREQAIENLLLPEPGLALINTLGCRRREIISLPSGEIGSQADNSGQALGVVEIPAYALMSLEKALVQDNRTVSAVQNELGVTLENEMVRVQINSLGQIVSLYHKAAERECIEVGAAANQFVLYEDLPAENDAWNVDIYYAEKILQMPVAQTISLLENDPLRVKVGIEMHVGQNSHLWQEITLTAISSQLEFETRVDWHEEHAFLRVHFPLKLRAAQASFETQFGYVQRSTHNNTSYDLAQFEVPAQRWADLSEPDFGVSLLNNGKYGYSCKGNILSLSLLRAPSEPDPLADRGEHRFAYALLPHALTAALSTVWWPAACFNQPLLLEHGRVRQDALKLAEVNAPNVVLDTIKMAEDGKGFILRLYEAGGSATSFILSSIAIRQAWECDLLEENKTRMTVENGRIKFNLLPFQIKTVRLQIQAFV